MLPVQRVANLTLIQRDHAILVGVGRGSHGLLYGSGDLIHTGIQHIAVQSGHQFHLLGIAGGAPVLTGPINQIAFATVGIGPVDAGGNVVGQTGFGSRKGEQLVTHLNINDGVNIGRAVDLFQRSPGFGTVHAGQITLTHPNAGENIARHGDIVCSIAAKAQCAEKDQNDQKDADDGCGIFTLSLGRAGSLSLADTFFLFAQCQSLLYVKISFSKYIIVDLPLNSNYIAVTTILNFFLKK